jgi:hypothetical protein
MLHAGRPIARLRLVIVAVGLLGLVIAMLVGKATQYTDADAAADRLADQSHPRTIGAPPTAVSVGQVSTCLSAQGFDVRQTDATHLKATQGTFGPVRIRFFATTTQARAHLPAASTDASARLGEYPEWLLANNTLVHGLTGRADRATQQAFGGCLIPERRKQQLG